LGLLDFADLQQVTAGISKEATDFLTPSFQQQFVNTMSFRHGFGTGANI
jgi:hypothetical protein